MQNIRLVLVTAPLPSAYVQDTQNYQAYVDAMRSFAAANGTQYWAFLRSLRIPICCPWL